MIIILTVIAFVGFQLFIFLIIAFFLKRTLQKNLVEMGVHQFEMMFAHSIDPEINEIKVVAYSSFDPSMQARLRKSVERKLGKEIKITIEQNRSIKGGLIIQCGSSTIDTSLLSRLKECGWEK